MNEKESSQQKPKVQFSQKAKGVLVVCWIAGMLLYYSVDFSYEKKMARYDIKNRANVTSIHDCIYNREHKNTNIISMGNTFNINYVESTTTDCPDPYFPAIHIKTKAEHNAWFYVRHTEVSKKHNNTYEVEKTNDAFFSFEQDYYDTPYWYHIASEVDLWQNNVYAINMNHINKTIRCVGGISWGFIPKKKLLLIPSVDPKMTSPSSLTCQNMIRDLQTTTEYKEYQLIE
jgi:hypothetical protein